MTCGFVGDSYQEARQRYISNALEAWRITRRTNLNPGWKIRDGKSGGQVFPATEAAEEQLALAGQNTELAKLKYQTAQGELKTLTEMQKQELLRNAALIDQQKIRERLRSGKRPWGMIMWLRVHQMKPNCWDTGRRTSRGTHAGVAADP